MSGKTTYIVGVDVGQGPEPSALAVVEIIPAKKKTVTPTGRLALCGATLGKVAGQPVEVEEQGALPRLRCSYLQRLPPGTNFTDLAKRLRKIEEKLLSSGDFTYRNRIRGNKDVRIPEGLEIYLDITDTGRPVADLLQEALRADVVASRFSPGEPDYSKRTEWRVSKLELITQLKVMLQTKRLEIAGKGKDPEGERTVREMVAELENFQSKPPARDDGQELKVGARDDLVTALGLAVLGAIHRPPPPEPIFCGRL